MIDRKKLYLILLILNITIAGCSTTANKNEKVMIANVLNIPLTLPKSLESQRPLFEKYLINAQKRLIHFAINHGWEKHIKESFADKAIIFETHKDFKNYLIKSGLLDNSMEIPKTYSAVLENKELLLVSPEVYAENYPDGIEEDSYEKLMCHEMVHRLHVKILNGDEDKMGPVWFYEGFAIYGSNQFENMNIQLSESEMSEILKSKKRIDYKKYGVMIRYFLKTKSLSDLVQNAHDIGFNDYLTDKK